MDTNPLAEFLRRRSGTERTAATHVERAGFEAAPAPEVVGGTDMRPEQDESENPTRFRTERIELRPLRGLWSMPTYTQLVDVLFDGPNPSFLALVFVELLVIVKGRNLKSIVAGLRQRTQWIIEQYDSARDGPAPAGTPVVESMEFITDNIGHAVAVLRKGKVGEAA